MPLIDRYSNMPVREDVGGIEFSILRGAALDDFDGEIAEFLTYFREVQGERAMLSRADVHPEELKQFLVSMIIVDLVIEDGQVADIIPRLVGSEIEHFYGGEPGISIHTHPNQESVKRVFRSAQAAVDGREPVIALTRGKLAGDQQLCVTSLYFPMSDDGENVNMMLGYVKIAQG